MLAISWFGVGRFWIERLPSREGKQSVRQRSRARGGTLRGRDVALHVHRSGPVQPAALSSSRLPEDPGQQVVEIVRQAAGQLADSFHLLRLE